MVPEETSPSSAEALLTIIMIFKSFYITNARRVSSLKEIHISQAVKSFDKGSIT